jgi:N-acetylglucosamine-6-sulfatase
MKFLRKLFLSACVVAITSCNTGTPVPRLDHPNIVFILTDDMAASDLAYMPQTNKLIGKKGATFDNFLVSISLCCPSRTSILRGQYGHNTKIVDNELPGGGFEKVYKLGLEESMFPVWLREAGYRTALFGKYLNYYPSPAGQTYVPPGWTDWYSPVDGDPYGEFNYTLNENGELVEYGSDPEDYGTDVYGSKAIEFIQDSIAQDQPFFAYIAPFAPHKPATPAPRHAGMYASLELPRPPSFNEEGLRDKLKTFLWKPPLTEEEISLYQDQYRLRIESLQSVDEMVAGIVSTLESAGHLEDTYIFFTSDNGYHLGEHRLPQGKNTPYEEDIRVPLLVRGPGIRAGLHIEGLAGNIDLASTFVELAGTNSPDFVDGRSLVPLLFREPVSSWRRAYLLERGLRPGPNQASETEEENTPSQTSNLLETPDSSFDEVRLIYVGLRTDDFTYIEFNNGTIQIYDLKKDPYQLENFASTADPALLERLHSQLSQLKECAGPSCRVIDGAP